MKIKTTFAGHEPDYQAALRGSRKKEREIRKSMATKGAIGRWIARRRLSVRASEQGAFKQFLKAARDERKRLGMPSKGMYARAGTPEGTHQVRVRRKK